MVRFCLVICVVFVGLFCWFSLVGVCFFFFFLLQEALSLSWVLNGVSSLSRVGPSKITVIFCEVVSVLLSMHE